MVNQLQAIINDQEETIVEVAEVITKTEAISEKGKDKLQSAVKRKRRYQKVLSFLIPD